MSSDESPLKRVKRSLINPVKTEPMKTEPMETEPMETGFLWSTLDRISSLRAVRVHMQLS